MVIRYQPTYCYGFRSFLFFSNIMPSKLTRHVLLTHNSVTGISLRSPLGLTGLTVNFLSIIWCIKNIVCYNSERQVRPESVKSRQGPKNPGLHKNFLPGSGKLAASLENGTYLGTGTFQLSQLNCLSAQWWIRNDFLRLGSGSVIISDPDFDLACFQILIDAPNLNLYFSLKKSLSVPR
jgi:hypothetical protein